MSKRGSMGLRFDHSASLVSAVALQTFERRLQPEIARMRAATNQGYDDKRASISLPHDTALHKTVVQMARRYQTADILIVVGIGGSNLGTMAVAEALLGKDHNETHRPKVYFSDTTDEIVLARTVRMIKQAQNKGKRVIINGVSKSGTTTETIANFEVLIDRLHTLKGNVIITTDRDSPYWKLAQQYGFDVLEIPRNVGGRYSVFSAVGLFPLAMMGINIDALRKGAQLAVRSCIDPRILRNPAAQRAAILAHHYKQGIRISNQFMFSTDLEAVGKWYRQLMGESIGKEYNASHTKKLYAGITPTVAIGSTDLHSLAQLYLGGPNNTFHTFVIPSYAGKLKVPTDESYNRLVPHIQGKSIRSIMEAIIGGVTAAFAKAKRPYYRINLELTAESIGELLQVHMIEMMYLGYLLGVNPFDQPNVEAYKIITKRILAK